MRWTRDTMAAAALAAALFTTSCRGKSLFQQSRWPETPESQFSRAWRGDGPYRQGGEAAGQPSAQPGLQPGSQNGTQPGTSGGEAPLIGWDGGVVDGPASGSVQRTGPERGLEPSGSGRMHIIELYQEVLDERDAMRDEIAALTSALERSQGLYDQAHATVGALEARVAELEAERDRVTEENTELTARLTTAQIRRLEAEKLLLETRIEELRRGPVVAPPPAGDKDEVERP